MVHSVNLFNNYIFDDHALVRSFDWVPDSGVV